MPWKMTMMFKKYIITLQTSNYKLKKSVFMADFLSYMAFRICISFMVILFGTSPAPEPLLTSETAS